MLDCSVIAYRVAELGLSCPELAVDLQRRGKHCINLIPRRAYASRIGTSVTDIVSKPPPRIWSSSAETTCDISMHGRDLEQIASCRTL